MAGELELAGSDARIEGEADGDYAGNAVGSAGDVDGEGQLDLIIGANSEATGGRDAGAAYLILGPVSGSMSLASAASKFIGEAPSSNAGTVVGSAGDMDADGYGDILVSAPGLDTGSSGAGAVYLFYGGGY